MGKTAAKFRVWIIQHQGIVDELKGLGSSVEGASERIQIVWSIVAETVRSDAGLFTFRLGMLDTHKTGIP